ncbi:hypothetical protein C1645_835920 [Glomus cerebriforme]|uniref:Protein kinase domain-containing protein n=1 Tax=Glomus cerebriforme TaxID=658196 RepID=A0A397SBH6_9GLOM|nr:hypothetical protein C1645_835920 [Glomus cerebriforme]
MYFALSKLYFSFPQLISDIAKQCVDVDPSKRPTADDLFEKFYQWLINLTDSEINKQIKEADEFNEKQPILNLQILHILKLFIQVYY